jgi:hypothetical protein
LARRAAAVPLVLLVVLSATGWLYVIQTSGVRPAVGDALPLDELARHSSASLPWFVVVWGGAAVFLGLYARWARIERTKAALLLGLGVGLLAYIETGVAIAIVRQVPFRDALDVASRREAVYLPAVLVAVAAAVLAPRRRVGRRAPFIVASIVAAGALLNVLHAIIPGDDEGLLHSLTPDVVGPLAQAAGVLVAVAMLVAPPRARPAPTPRLAGGNRARRSRRRAARPARVQPRLAGLGSRTRAADRSATRLRPAG